MLPWHPLCAVLRREIVAMEQAGPEAGSSSSSASRASSAPPSSAELKVTGASMACPLVHPGHGSWMVVPTWIVSPGTSGPPDETEPEEESSLIDIDDNDGSDCTNSMDDDDVLSSAAPSRKRRRRDVEDNREFPCSLPRSFHSEVGGCPGASPFQEK